MRRNGCLGLVLVVLLAVLAVGAAAIWLWSGAGRPPAATSSDSELLLAVLDVGQADSILIRSPTGRTMLVDAGNEQSDVNRVILPYMRKAGVSSLDYVVVTHPDQDHVGGMPAVLEGLQVGAFVDPVLPGVTNQSYLQTLQLVKSKGIAAIKARRGLTAIQLGGGTTVQVLGPEDPLLTASSSFTNGNAVVLRISLGAVSVFLAADMEPESEERLLTHHDGLQSQILKVAHHGSRSSTTAQFLNAVRPEVALISVGRGNSYGHPHRELLQRLQQRGIRIYRTDLNGTIEVAINGQGYRVMAEKTGG